MHADLSRYPITLADVMKARFRFKRKLHHSPCRRYLELDAAVGHDISVWVKHENHQPTNAFKVRNALSAMTVLSKGELGAGVIAATRGNHGLGVAWAARKLKIPATICVPHGNNPEKNAGMRALGAELIETGDDYDASLAAMRQLVRERGLAAIHSTNNRAVIAGAGTITLEMIEHVSNLDALIVSVGGGSQAVGALTVAAELMPGLKVYGVQAERASAIHDSWHQRRRIEKPSADTFADGLATRMPYDLTFDALSYGLADFITVSEAEMADAIRLLLRTTHNLAEGAGAAGLAGLMKLRSKLKGHRVGIILSGGNIDAETLKRVLNHEL